MICSSRNTIILEVILNYNLIYEIEYKDINSIFWLCEDIRYMDEEADVIFSFKYNSLKIMRSNLSRKEIEYILKLNYFNSKPKFISSP